MDTNWELHTTGPADAHHTVLMLPGGLGTAAFYDDVIAEPALTRESIKLVATTLPGFGDTRPLDDPTIENYAMEAGKLAAGLGCDVVVGHSMGANVALEMAALGVFSGSIVLLSPTFSREDEAKELGTLNSVGRIPGIGLLAWTAMVKLAGVAFKGAFPDARQKALITEMKKARPSFCRRSVRRYYEYLDHHGALVPRLCESGVRAWVVRGDRDEIGLKDEERRELEVCASVTMVTVPDATHFVLTDQPARTAEVILEAVRQTAAAD